MNTISFKAIPAGLKVFCLISALLVGSACVYLFTGHSWPPERHIISIAISPDRQWAAVIEEEEYKSMFTPSFYAVVLQPQTGWFREVRGKKIFEESRESAVNPPTVIWGNASDITIGSDALARDVTFKASEYGNVRISYKN